ncbi:MAG: ribosome biogenesis GTP-binding protein YihA/YsxC [Gammaproteobacteria bacterium]
MAIMTLTYAKTTFLTSVPNHRLAPEDRGAEVAFAGRSNAGKSSALNTITNQKSLARTSKTPGRTQQLNFFAMDDDHRLVDLPGYGFAKVPQKMKLQWQANMSEYLQKRQSLRGLLMMMDCRRPLTEYDIKMLQWCHAANLRTHILLTKADKLSRGPAKSALLDTEKKLAGFHPDATIQLFSSLKKTGVEEARQVINDWLTEGSGY